MLDTWDWAKEHGGDDLESRSEADSACTMLDVKCAWNKIGEAASTRWRACLWMWTKMERNRAGGEDEFTTVNRIHGTMLRWLAQLREHERMMPGKGGANFKLHFGVEFQWLPPASWPFEMAENENGNTVDERHLLSVLDDTDARPY